MGAVPGLCEAVEGAYFFAPPMKNGYCHFIDILREYLKTVVFGRSRYEYVWNPDDRRPRCYYYIKNETEDAVASVAVGQGDSSIGRGGVDVAVNPFVGLCVRNGDVVCGVVLWEWE